MTDREKLMELLSKAPLGNYPLGEQFSNGTVEKIADYLLKNGVIAPPVKVGDAVYTNVSWTGWYLREKDKPYKAKVVYIGINGKENHMNVVYEKNDNMLTFTFDEIGDRLFLTYEEAKKALMEMNENE